MDDLKMDDSLLFGIFIIKKCVEFHLTSLGTLKYD